MKHKIFPLVVINPNLPDSIEEIRQAKTKYLNLDLTDIPKMIDFYQEQTDKRYVKEIHVIRGPQYYSKQESQKLNPFLNESSSIPEFDKEKYLTDLQETKEQIVTAQEKVDRLGFYTAKNFKNFYIWIFSSLIPFIISAIGIILCFTSSILAAGIIMIVAGMIGFFGCLIMAYKKRLDTKKLRRSAKYNYDKVLGQVHYLTKHQYWHLFVDQKAKKELNVELLETEE